MLEFQSRADTKSARRTTATPSFHQDVYLLTARSHIETALTDSTLFSNAPYRALGSGTFMLALDPDKADHKAQREFARAYLNVDARTIDALARVAFLAGAVLPLKQRKFDLADLAEQVALRFVGFLFGFEQADHALLEQTMRKAYRGLNYQIVGRHFVSEPGTMVDAAAGWAHCSRERPS